MIQIALRIAINAAALWVAARLVDGVTLTEEWTGILIVAVIFGLINALLRPLALLLSVPFLLLTLGLFTLVVNAGMLALTARLTDRLDVDGFWPALWGALIITLVSWLLSSVLISENERG